MPVQKGKDSEGHYYQWGDQKKYYYTPDDKDSEAAARSKAYKQGRAAYANGYKGDK